MGIEPCDSKNVTDKEKQLAEKYPEASLITDSDVRHIKKNHGQGETERGQVNITPEDFALIPAVMNEFDTVRHEDTDRKGNKKILFVKKVNGNVYTASVQRGNSQRGNNPLENKSPIGCLDELAPPHGPTSKATPTSHFNYTTTGCF